MYVAGIDIGSVASKVVILDEEKDIINYVVMPALPSEESASKVFSKALEDKSLSQKDIAYIVATGYGRVNVPLADRACTEILCHAVGINYLFPSVRTVIDIGGQDSKAIKISKVGRVENFIMNDKCAAGTGRFLEVMQGVLGVEFSKWGDLVAKAKSTASISSICTVFAESEVISKVTQKVLLEEIIAGVCESIAIRVGQLAKRLPVEKDICLTGGVAYNKGVVQKLGEFLGVDLLVAELPQSTGALGAALMALRDYESLKIENTSTEQTGQKPCGNKHVQL